MALFVTLFALLFGLPYALFVPPGQPPDEFAHFNRAINVSAGHCVATIFTSIPESVRDMELKFVSPLENAPAGSRWMTADDFTKWLSAPSAQGVYNTPNAKANIYSCIPYLASGFAITGGRLAALPPLALLYAGRLANFAIFLALVWAALALLPDFHLPLIGLILMPMTLSQAASLSADAVTLGVTFLLIAYILHLAYDPSVVQLTRRDLTTLAVLIVLCALTKFNLFLILLILLIPKAKLPGRFNKAAFVTACLVLAIAMSAAWQLSNSRNWNVFMEHEVVFRHIDPTANAAWIYRHPVLFLSDVGVDLSHRWSLYLISFVGRIGWFTIPVPAALAYLYIGCLAACCITRNQRVHFQSWARLLLLSVFVGSSLGVFMLLFNFETPQAYTLSSAPSVSPIIGIQGRYFIPFALTLMLAVSNSRLRLPRRYAMVPLFGVAALANGAVLERVWTHYYAAPQLRDGDLVYSRKAGEFSVMYGGEMCRVPKSSAVSLLKPGTKLWTDSDAAVSRVREGPPLSNLKLAVFRDAGTGSVFLVQDGVRHWIPDPATVISMHLATMTNNTPVNVIEALPIGTPMPHLSPPPPIAILRLPGTGEVFLVQNGLRHSIPDPETITSMHIADQIRDVPDIVIEGIPLGSPIPHLSPPIER